MIYGNVIHRSVALKALLVNQQGETRSENRLRRSRDSSLCNRYDEFFTADGCSW